MSYNEQIDSLVVSYAELAGLTEAQYSGLYTISNNGDDTDSYISRWNVVGLSQPSKAQLLAIDPAAAEVRRIRRLKLRNLLQGRLETLTSAQATAILPRLPDGCIFFNSTTGKINYISGGAAVPV